MEVYMNSVEVIWKLYGNIMKNIYSAVSGGRWELGRMKLYEFNGSLCGNYMNSVEIIWKSMKVI